MKSTNTEYTHTGYNGLIIESVDSICWYRVSRLYM